MNSDITIVVPRSGIPQVFSAAATAAAMEGIFEDYHARKSPNTLDSHRYVLLLFTKFLQQFNYQPGDFFNEAEAWRGLKWGLVDAFVKWMINTQNYAMGTVNLYLSVIKTYAHLAMRSGVIPHEDFTMITSIPAYSIRDGIRIDTVRVHQHMTTRRTTQKPAPIIITEAQANNLKTHPDTPQGRRDALLMIILLDHGLRIGEVALLRSENVDLEGRTFKFVRPKVFKEQIHEMTPDSYHAFVEFMTKDRPKKGYLLKRSLRSGYLSDQPWSKQAMMRHVHELGVMRLGYPHFCAHDCRHYYATMAARCKTEPFALRDAGGWNSLAMPNKYVEGQAIANAGVKLPKGIWEE
jgi:integrase